ncbi:TOPRIM nucleotidyl transferase/hydrolase domain-containing protein [Kutzneria buriramensis]|uniref:TOPRIM nucleotidyl transferase/hydrolase domain-containing protein n=1 Tax=Kutzneria buriramensis TaxID=1045776 RepID=UPI001B88607F|nr:TOPRIM nucleotidyl transferase/hydrolase domain-containing protein [Kutzneria buriramensis]
MDDLLDRDATRVVVLVEGISDQVAVETLAARHGRDLAAEGVVILPVGGAHGVRRHVQRLLDFRLLAICDAGEAHVVQRAMAEAGRGDVFVCDRDLEDELIRAAGTDRVKDVFAAHGDLTAFHTIQRQPAWRGKDEAAQMRRFLAAGARRKLRYARLLTAELDHIPPPLTALLAAI